MKAIKNTMKTATKTKNTYVIVRTRTAGVHVGEFVCRNGCEVELKEARRIWYWQGANTLHEISLSGVGSGSKISVAVARIVLLDAIEIIDATDNARASLETVPWD